MSFKPTDKEVSKMVGLMCKSLYVLRSKEGKFVETFSISSTEFIIQKLALCACGSSFTCIVSCTEKCAF